MPTPTGSMLSKDHPVEEIYLPRAPLALALAQVRFPQVPELIDEEHISHLRDRLKQGYPILREEKSVGLILSAAGITEGPQTERVLRFSDKVEVWQVSISQNFIALSTAAYSTREDFCARFEQVVALVADVVTPVVFDRVGIRYINRFTGEDLNKLDSLITEPFLGLTSKLATPAEITQSFTQTILHLEEAEIAARWGLLPSGAILDAALPPTAGPNWVLDVDTFQERKEDFGAAEIGRRVREYAEIAYRFFRLAATDELLNHAGAGA
jgi:uncharacterized protein (TIGR04255 family)